MQALVAQLFEALYPFLVFWVFALAEMIRIIAKLGSAVGQRISAWLTFVMPQLTQNSRFEVMALQSFSSAHTFSSIRIDISFPTLGSWVSSAAQCIYLCCRITVRNMCV
jgi:hypothetical protein